MKDDKVVPFPVHLAGGRRQGDGTRHARVPVSQGSVDVYFGDNGMAGIDACLPAALVLRLLREIGYPAQGLNVPANSWDHSGEDS